MRKLLAINDTNGISKFYDTFDVQMQYKYSNVYESRPK